MRREENWAIAPERIRLFFREQQRTIVILEGPDADTDRIYRRFFLHFLSAGG